MSLWSVGCPPTALNCQVGLQVSNGVNHWQHSYTQILLSRRHSYAHQTLTKKHQNKLAYMETDEVLVARDSEAWTIKTKPVGMING